MEDGIVPFILVIGENSEKKTKLHSQKNDRTVQSQYYSCMLHLIKTRSKVKSSYRAKLAMKRDAT